jgi:hypothetical protein
MLTLTGSIHEIVRDQRAPLLAVLRVTIDGTRTRATIPASLEQAGQFIIGERINIIIGKEVGT